MSFDRRRKRYHNYYARKRGYGRFGGFKGGGGGHSEAPPKQDKAFYAQRRGGVVREYRSGDKPSFAPTYGRRSGDPTKDFSGSGSGGRRTSGLPPVLDSLFSREDHASMREAPRGPGAKESPYFKDISARAQEKVAEIKKRADYSEGAPKSQREIAEINREVDLLKVQRKEGEDMAVTWKDQDTDELSATLGQEKKEEWKGHAIGRTMGPSSVRKTLHGQPMTRKVLRALRNAEIGQAHRTKLQMARALGEIDPLMDDIYSDYH